ncbi:hypothetical protein M8C21_009817, partial [Ambrosia artemisiifolia]
TLVGDISACSVPSLQPLCRFFAGNHDLRPPLPGCRLLLAVYKPPSLCSSTLPVIPVMTHVVTGLICETLGGGGDWGFVFRGFLSSETWSWSCWTSIIVAALCRLRRKIILARMFAACGCGTTTDPAISYLIIDKELTVWLQQSSLFAFSFFGLAPQRLIMLASRSLRFYVVLYF